jgi:hypothetical protein
MAILTLEECKNYLDISDDGDLTTTGTTATGSDIIIAIPTTDGIREGNSITASAFTSSALVASIPSDGVSLVIDQAAGSSLTGMSFKVSNRGSAYDAMITLYIPAVEAFINTYCRDTFTSWSDDLKATAAKMVWLNISNAKKAGVKTSESLGDYSVSYAEPTQFMSAYSASILAVLNMYRKVFFI